jgi:hypothetical protein
MLDTSTQLKAVQVEIAFGLMSTKRKLGIRWL